MPALTFVSWSQTPDAQERSHIADLVIVSHGGSDILMSSTRHDGQLISWDIAGPMQILDTIDYRGGAVLGSTGDINVVDTVRGTAVISAGGNGNTLQTHVVGADGSLSNPRVMVETASTSFSAMHSFETLTMTAGTQMVFGAIAGQSGVACLLLSDAGVLLQTDMIADTTASYAGNIAATASVTSGGQSFLITASGGTDTGISTWLIGANGQVTHMAGLSPDTGLWVSDPTALATAQIDGETYIVMGSAGSNSLTVLHMGTGGALTVTDHLLDDRHSRFSGVTDVQTVIHNGQTYVIAGGNDDGISLFVLMPDGQLVVRAHIADTTQMGLDNVSAIVARSNGDGIDIFVSSSSETGITQLHYDSGPQGLQLIADANGATLQGADSSDLLIGGASADYIVAGAGDDIIRDGAGADTLHGGSGADTFIIDYDSSTDRVRDFVVGVDRIDLSNWPGLRSINQLGFTTRTDGVMITYGADTLIIQSADGNPIDPASLTTADLLGGVRIPNMITPGFAGPNPVTPDLPVYVAPDLPVYVAPIAVPSAGPFGDRNIQTDIQMAGTYQNNTLTGADANDLIAGYAGHDTLSGLNGHDVIIGGSGYDRINGDNGHDVLFGGWGHDRLAGGNGNDQLFGEEHNDRLYGGRGNDQISGGSGDDWINGGMGDDRLMGGAGQDMIIGNRGADIIDGGDARDRIFGGGENDVIRAGGGNDYVNGSTGSDLIFGGRGADLIKGHTSADRLYGDAGHDTLFGEIGNDRLYGGTGDDYLGGGVGHDRLYGGADNDRLYGQSGADIVNGGAGDDFISGGSSADFLVGGTGRDRLYGGVGNDRLLGQDGSDILNGGLGNDSMVGGGGRDTFVFTQGADLIEDFDPRYDRLILDHDLWAGRLSDAAILDRFGSIQNGNVVLDFGMGDVLTLDGISNMGALVSQIDVA